MEKSNLKKKMAVVVMSLGLLTGGIFAGQELAKEKSPIVRHAATTTTFSKTTYEVTANLNIRSGASTKHRVVTKIPKGSKVTSSSRIGSWYKVSYNGKSGYAYSKYLKKLTLTNSSSSSSTYVTKSSVALKAGRHSKHKTLTTIPKGKSVIFVKAYGSWTQVKYGSKTGYVPSKTVAKKTTSSKSPSSKPSTGKELTTKEKTKAFESVFSKGQTPGEYELLHLVKSNGDTIELGTAGMVFAESRGIMIFDRIQYNSAYERSDVFGEEARKEYELMYNKYNSAIQAYSKTTIGANSYSTLRKEFEKFAYNAGSGKTIQVKTIDGHKIEFKSIGQSLYIQTK